MPSKNVIMNKPNLRAVSRIEKFFAAAFSPRRRLVFALMIFAAIDIFGCTTLRAQSDEKTWHVLIEPKFMHPEISFPIPGAERTVLVPGWLGDDGELHYFLKKDWDALNLDWSDEVIAGACLTHEGQLKHEGVKKALGDI